MYDVSKVHVSELIAETFRYSHIVFASVTYNLGIHPPMHNYLMDMKALNVQKKTEVNKMVLGHVNVEL